jgi:RNA polymerase sigma factor (sigma-70 family)
MRQGYLLKCLSKLNDFKRQVIRLYYSSGMTTKGIAEKLGRNTAAIEKTLVRTRGHLRECIETASRREGRL